MSNATNVLIERPFKNESRTVDTIDQEDFAEIAFITSNLIKGTMNKSDLHQSMKELAASFIDSTSMVSGNLMPD